MSDKASLGAYDSFASYALRQGIQQRGHHHDNFVVSPAEDMAALLGLEPGVPVTLRRRHAGPLPVVLRTWQDETQILQSIKGLLKYVPQCLAKGDGSAVHSYVQGVPLSTVCPDEMPLDERLLHALAGLLAEMTAVHRERLPELPPSWPCEGSSGSFLRTLTTLTEAQVRLPNWPAFGGLFAALGVPEDAMKEFAGRVPSMVDRPFSLLHTDLHRDNVIFSYSESDAPLICVDWELASYGDPLHDLATHLVRMRYPAAQWDDVKEAWARAMRSVRPEAVHGLDTDVQHYIDFEHAQSVYPDVMRAAHSLGLEAEPTGLETATESVRRALELAARPLRLRGVPDAKEIRSALYRWHAALPGRASRAAAAAVTVEWCGTGWGENDGSRVGLPHDAVVEALSREGAAPAEHVFKGTGHLNTAVRVGRHGRPVIVRRRLNDRTRREPRFLEEHDVLLALAAVEGDVRAPQLLAFGTSKPNDAFAVHSYVGTADRIRPPEHPVDGLSPREADDLVDQLCALTRVPTERLHSSPSYGDFYQWLSAQLVKMVAALPEESRQLAVALGLPDATRLRDLLGGRFVTPRNSVLLHGDLNPWNLVRDGESGELTIIDWEMAMVGDPLYDLVRHLHLTPHSPGMRDRMLHRWSSQLDSGFTKGWEEEWRYYRCIEIVRSAYIDLDRLVTADVLDAPNVDRALSSYSLTLSRATEFLGLRTGRIANPYLEIALPGSELVGH